MIFCMKLHRHKIALTLSNFFYFFLFVFFLFFFCLFFFFFFFWEKVCFGFLVWVEITFFLLCFKFVEVNIKVTPSALKICCRTNQIFWKELYCNLFLISRKKRIQIISDWMASPLAIFIEGLVSSCSCFFENEIWHLKFLTIHVQLYSLFPSVFYRDLSQTLGSKN